MSRENIENIKLKKKNKKNCMSQPGLTCKSVSQVMRLG
jgi:hypothetical protein